MACEDEANLLQKYQRGYTLKIHPCKSDDETRIFIHKVNCDATTNLVLRKVAAKFVSRPLTPVQKHLKC